MAELHARGKRVVIVCSGEATSRTDCTNTLGTLRTLNHLCEEDHICLPCIVVETDTDRSKADKYIIDQVTGLIKLLTLEVMEVDRNDRLNWLNPMYTCDIPAGLRPLYVFSAEHTAAADADKLSDPMIVTDSALYLGVDISGDRTYETFPSREEQFRKDGLLVAQNAEPITGVIVPDLSGIEDIIKAVQRKQALFAAQTDGRSAKVRDSLSAPDGRVGVGRIVF